MVCSCLMAFFWHAFRTGLSGKNINQGSQNSLRDFGFGATFEDQVVACAGASIAFPLEIGALLLRALPLWTHPDWGLLPENHAKVDCS